MTAANSGVLPYCSECGGSRVPHALYKSQFYLERAVALFGAPILGVGHIITEFIVRHRFDESAPAIAAVFARLGLGTLDSSLDPRDSTRTQALFDGARTEGVTLQHFRFFGADHDGIFMARKDGKTVLFSAMPRPRRFNSPSLDWMDDKGRLKEHLHRHGIPTAEGGIATSQKSALALFEKIGAPVIVKPHQGTRGRHTRIGITTKEELLRAYEIATQISPHAIVEKELSGIVHRVTLVGGAISAVVRRDYPHIIGDGVSTISRLVEKENADPRRDGHLYYRIATTERAEAQLRLQNLGWDSIPARGQRVPLNDKVSRTQGTVAIDVTDDVHGDNIELFERLAESLGDPLIGVDFIIGDMKRSWKSQEGCGVVECNTMPYIDLHHYPYEGKVRNVAGDLWAYIFANHR